ncbi:MAG: hypothetical protein CL566_10085 [Alphaproteobacteria bacterium]|nr:hypothetical protein [Alphaproteobacteria bacterium]|tara:strand:+ start:260 stop:700 length:441 start_codon:yes stop_codon:yes gene_type:complete
MRHNTRMAITSNKDVTEFREAEPLAETQNTPAAEPGRQAGIWVLCRKQANCDVDIFRAFDDAERARVNLAGTDLCGANLSQAKLNGAVLRDCNMSPLIIDSARRLPVQLTGADLQSVALRGADISKAVLDDAKLEGARRDDDDRRT